MTIPHHTRLATVREIRKDVTVPESARKEGFYTCELREYRAWSAGPTKMVKMGCSVTIAAQIAQKPRSFLLKGIDACSKLASMRAESVQCAPL